MLRRRSRVLASMACVIAAAGVGIAVFLAFVEDDDPAAPAAIVFERGDGLNPSIYAMAADGTDARELAAYGSQPRWSPGGRRIAFVVHSPPEDDAPPDELWVFSADGTDASRVARMSWIRAIAWSPDGSRIAWVTSRGWPWDDRIWVVDLRSGERRIIVPTIEQATSLDWSPDGRTLLTVTGGKLATVDVAKGRVLPIEHGVDASEPVWSPDGRLIAYIAPTDPAPLRVAGHEPVVVRLRRSVFVVNVDGSGRRRLTRGGVASSPSWSPSGDAIVFSRGILSKRALFPFETDIYTVSVNGKGLRRLTDGGENAEPDWRPRRRHEAQLRLERMNPPEASVRVPDVRELELRDARRAIEEAGLRPIPRTVAGRLPLGTLVAQSPTAGTPVPPGTAVVLTVASGEPGIVVRPGG